MNSRVALLRATIPRSTNVYGESFEELKLADSLAVSSLQAYLVAQQDSWEILAINPVLDKLTAVQTAQTVLAFAPLAAGISLTYQWQQPWAAEFAATIKAAAPDIHIVVGGMYATSAWSQLLREIPEIDSVCRFEGERTLLELVQLLRQGLPWQGADGLAYRDASGNPVFRRLRQRIVDLGSLPFPTRDYLPAVLAAGGVIQIEASRACNAHCTFCDVRMTGWIGRPVRHLIDELEGLVASHPGHEVWIVDNIFIGFGKGRFERAQAIAHEIIRRGIDVRFTFQDRAENVDLETFALLKKAGLNKVYLGIETFAASALERWQKGGSVEVNIAALRTLRELEIFTQIGFLVFDDGTTLTEIHESLAGLRAVAIGNPYLHLHNFNELIPYAGTHLARAYERKYGHPPDSRSPSIWNFGDERVSRYRQWAWEFLVRIWPATEVIFHHFDDPGFQQDLLMLVSDKNRHFIDYMTQLLSVVESGGDPAELCAAAVAATRGDLLKALDRWRNPTTKPTIMSAIARV